MVVVICGIKLIEIRVQSRASKLLHEHAFREKIYIENRSTNAEVIARGTFDNIIGTQNDRECQFPEKTSLCLAQIRFARRFRKVKNGVGFSPRNSPMQNQLRKL